MCVFSSNLITTLFLVYNLISFIYRLVIFKGVLATFNIVVYNYKLFLLRLQFCKRKKPSF